MKVELNEKGVLTVKAQSVLESYALGKWADDNMKDGIIPNISVDWSVPFNQYLGEVEQKN